MNNQYEKMQKLAFGKVIIESKTPYTLTESTLKDKIKEIIHSTLGEAKKKKKDVAPQEDIDIDLGAEETLEEPTDTITPSPTDEIDIDPKVKAIQDALSKALANAKALGDEKLTNQIGNTITMLVRTQVVGQQQKDFDIKENIHESILKIYHYDPSSYKLIDVEAESYPSEEEAKKAALAHNWQIAWDNEDTDLSKEEYINKYSWDDLDNISYYNYGYEIK